MGVWKQVFIAALLFGCAGGNKAAAAETSAYEPFQKAVDRYWELRQEVAKKAAKPPDRATAEQINLRKQQLRELISAARAGARQGEVFVPAMRESFRAAVRAEVKGPSGKSAKVTIMDDNPRSPGSPGNVQVAVNASYPSGTPRTTLPPSLLLRLPTLRQGLEYRFVGRTLILEDTEAAMIVDYLPNALPGGSPK